MKRLILITTLIALFALSIGCAAAAVPDMRQVEPNAPAPPGAFEANDSATTGGVANQRKAQESQNQSGDGSQAQGDARMIVYTGAVSLQVNDTAETIAKIEGLLKNVNGYVANKSLVAFGKDKLRGSINIRIPATALATTLGEIKALGVKVLKESADSNDVTAEYVDLDARRKNLEVYEIELQKLLETVRERTGKAEEILAVYNTLTQVRGEIEQIKGRQRYLENTSTLATYTIELVPVEDVVVEGKPGWDPGRTARQALDRLVTTMQGLTDVAITFTLSDLPVLIILALPIVFFVWIVRALMKRRAPKKQAAVN